MRSRVCIGIFLFLFFSVLFFCFCGINAAGGFETTNGVRITVCADSLRGKAVPGSQIIFCDTLFKAFDLNQDSFVDTVYADQNGDFKFYCLKNGRYNLVARSVDLRKGAVIANIDIDKLNLLERSESAEYLFLGSISGTLIFDTTIEQSERACLVYIRGMAIFDSTITGNYKLSNVPPGKYQIQAYQKINRGVNTKIYYASKENIVLMESGNETGVDLILELVE
jgi:hypothetical protein